ncbi:2'-5' RNA ligase family protein [Brevibacillus fulvus]|uniref:Putative phosphoesterase JOD01_002545 n=1 Tax=Brevibacillus fulvus TaxID=1125967 RepID=A0A938XUX7_9BACL|nr:2'-5' RNA ligase family protein [Brevibacillus fulvus]MBM7590933.1 2'-5' RNA ligase [Brevibacillus fulvus]
MRYSIVVFPSSKVQEAANSYRKRFDPAYALIPPYIRIKEPFEWAEADLPELVNHLEEVAQSTERFATRFHRVSSFHPTTNVLYFAIQNKEPFEKLHEKIAQKCVNQKETYAYVPHLTIGRDLSDDELRDLTGQLSMAKIDLETEVDRFSLVYELEDGIWSVYQTFLLK